MDNDQLRFRSFGLPRFSVVTCFNDREILEENLLKSLRQQHNPIFELITIDNTNKNFLSLPSALNYGGKTAIGEYILFVHQDVYLCGDFWFDQALSFLQKLPKVGAVGVAGVDWNGTNRGFILDRGRYWGSRLNAPSVVQTLDEQLIIIPQTIFKKLKFDEFFDFHSYGADYCLSVQHLGLKVYVLPLMVEHNSLTIGTLNASSIEKQNAFLYGKHSESCKIIYKTTGTLGRKRDVLRTKLVSFYPNFIFLTSLAILELWHIHLNNKNVLDLCCLPFEQHILKKHLSKKKLSVGVSPKRRYLLVSKKLGVHDDYVIASPEKLPFKMNSFDVVFSLGLLEYLPKDKCGQVISASEEVAQISIVRVPYSGSPIDSTHTVFSSNWRINDFKKRNYRTFSIGLKQQIFPRTLFAYKITWERTGICR